MKGIAITWERREDGKWHSTWPGIVKSYPWPQLNWYVLSEVVSGG